MPICKMCLNEFKITGFSTFFCKTHNICKSCYKEFNPKFIHFKKEDIECLAIYNYDENIKKLLYQFKGCYDIELKDIFIEKFFLELRLKYKGYIMVPIPSYIADDEKRGFNHVEQMFSCLNLPLNKVITKKYAMKQSELSKEEREKIAEVFIYLSTLNVENKKILIIDDVYTTGSSFLAVLRMVQKLNPRSIKALFLAKNEHK